MKQYIRCKYYDTSKRPEFKGLSYLIIKRKNGNLDLRGCQDCNGYNIQCEVYKELIESDNAERNNLQGGDDSE